MNRLLTSVTSLIIFGASFAFKASAQNIRLASSVASAIRDRGDFAQVGRSLRTPQSSATSRGDLDEAADSLVAIALSPGSANVAIRTRTAATLALGYASLPSEGRFVRYAGAESRLFAIARGSTEDDVRLTAIRALASPRDTIGFIGALEAVARKPGYAATWAIERLLLRTGKAGIDAARRLYLQQEVPDRDASADLARAAVRHGWNR